MKLLIEFILSQLTDHPNEAVAQITDQGDTMTVSIKVHPEDIGRVIGKEGRTINAIRSLAKVIAVKQKKKLLVSLVS